MAHGVPERLGHLAREGAPGGVGDGARDDHRPPPAVLLEQRLEGEDRGLGVEGVEDGLDEQEVRASVDEAPRLVEVRRHQLVVRHVAGAGVVDVGADRGGPVGRTQGSGHEPRALGRRQLVAHLAGQPCGRLVELPGEVLHAVVGLRDRGRGERVGQHDVGAGLEVLAVDRADHVRLSEAEQVAVALDVTLPVGEPLSAELRLAGGEPLDQGAHGTVDDQDPLAQRLGQRLGGVRAGRLWHGTPLAGRGGFSLGTASENVDSIPAS